MNSEESPEGSSCDGQENGDGYGGSERPLKKARFAWQVKGKYHLKNEKNDPTKISTTVPTVPEMAGPSGSESYASDCSNIGQDMTTEMNKNLNTFDFVVDEPDTSVLRPSTGNIGSESKPDNVFTPNPTVAKDLANPQNSVSCSQERSEFLTSLNLIEAPIGRTQEKITQTICPTFDLPGLNQVDTEDHLITSWQYRQIVKTNLDNSINRILETMKSQSEDGEYTMLEQRIECIENEGILMAISAHGLQNTSDSSSSLSSLSSSEDLEDIDVPIRIRFTPISEDESDDDESQDECQHEFECTLNNVEWTLTNQLRNIDDEAIPSPTFHGTSSLNLNYENLHNTDAASHDLEFESENHHDFLDAAVSTAIQSKGLTTFGTDYG